MKIRTTVLSLALLALGSQAWAQQPPPAAPAAARWDASGQLALLNRNKTDLGSWDHWYAAPMVGGSAGHYWTPHLKTELEIATAGTGTIDAVEDNRYREHRLRETIVGATAVYQFFDNQWVHPFLGAGVEVARERDRADSLPASTVRFSTPGPVPALRPVPAVDKTSYSVRPVVSGGFKFYVNERAFVRTEVRTSFSTEGTAPSGVKGPLAIEWRGGVGFDL